MNSSRRTHAWLTVAAPSVNSPMIDPAVEMAFPKEKVFEEVVLTKAIQEGIYALPPEQKIYN
jgi:hypothetical protein